MDRDRAVRRNTRLLVAAQVALWGALGSWAALAPVRIDDLTGRRGSAAVLIAVYYVAAGAGARLAGRLMDRAGRRAGLAAGYLVFAAGGAASLAAVWASTAEGLLAATFVLGLGVAAALLGRAAIADMHPPARRGRAVGTLVLGGTAGAVGGPFLAGAVHDAAGPAAPWLLVAGLPLVGLALVLAIRPDPRDLAVSGPRASGAARPPREIIRSRPGIAAAVAIGASQAVMATFMAIVPVTLHRHGAGQSAVSLVVALHLGAMFAFSSLVGAGLDRWGRRPGLLAGLSATLLGVALCAFEETALPAVGLFLIGLGWSAAYLGSTAIVSDLAGPAERAGAVGLLDLTAGISTAVGVMLGAVVVEAVGVGGLSAGSLAVVLGPLALVLALREPSPGAWEQAQA